MNKHFFILALALVLIACDRYSVSNISKPGKNNIDRLEKPLHPEVTVTDWQVMSMRMGPEVWANGKTEIVSQIGEAEFEAVKNNNDHRTIPPAMSAATKENRRNNPEYFKKLDRLHLYKIASFMHRSNGQDWGRMSILKAPYKGNEGWDAEVKWDSVYFILPDSVVTVKK